MAKGADLVPPAYSSWKQVAGYFDGDGNVGLEVEGEIRKDDRELKLGHMRLGKKYGYSTGVIKRVLGAR